MRRPSGDGEPRLRPPVGTPWRRRACAAVAVVGFVAFPVRVGASSADELVLQARAHEANREDDIAARRYTDALALDPANADAWLGLAALRTRLGDVREAERVYSAAFEHNPALQAALRGRARARWTLGRRKEAEVDLAAYADASGDVAALRELADWLADEGRAPAQLAIWRRLLVHATALGDADLEKESRRMVRALVILVDGADPVSSPVDPDATRKTMAHIARRGG
jgi:tetratricopeptide (TPR) repeat protein